MADISIGTLVYWINARDKLASGKVTRISLFSGNAIVRGILQPNARVTPAAAWSAWRRGLLAEARRLHREAEKIEARVVRAEVGRG